MTRISSAPGPSGLASDPLRILVVCTGNLCRSPLFAALLADRLGSDVLVTSRGTQAVAGETPPAATVLAARRLGVELDGHTARELDDADIDDADLVLVASRRHRRDVVRRSPRAATRVFTMLEFARLAGAYQSEHAGSPASASRDASGGRSTRRGLPTTDERGRPFAVVDAVVRSRGLVRRPANPDDDDVTDPMGRRAGVHRRVARQLAAAADLVAGALVAPGGDGPPPGAADAHAVGRLRRSRRRPVRARNAAAPRDGHALSHP
jgi:protein-tyrosine phosphatase